MKEEQRRIGKGAAGRHEPPPFSDNDPIHLRLIASFFRLIHTPWHVVTAPGLSRSETGLLLAIDRSMRVNESLRVSDLSRRMRVSSPTVTQHMNNMEAQGYVRRSQSNVDKRAVHLELTEKGFDALRQHHEAMGRNFAELVAVLGNDDAEKFVEMIRKTYDFFLAREDENDQKNIK